MLVLAASIAQVVDLDGRVQATGSTALATVDQLLQQRHATQNVEAAKEVVKQASFACALQNTACYGYVLPLLNLRCSDSSLGICCGHRSYKVVRNETHAQDFAASPCIGFGKRRFDEDSSTPFELRGCLHRARLVHATHMCVFVE